MSDKVKGWRIVQFKNYDGTAVKKAEAWLQANESSFTLKAFDVDVGNVTIAGIFS